MKTTTAIAAGIAAFKYLRGDQNARFRLTEVAKREFCAHGRLVDAMKNTERPTTFYGNQDGVPCGFLLYDLDSRKIEFRLACGFVWNGADILPDHLDAEPDKGLWRWAFLASPWHDFLYEFAEKIAVTYGVKYGDVIDFANALWRNDVPCWARWTGNAMNALWRPYKRIQKQTTKQ